MGNNTMPPVTIVSMLTIQEAATRTKQQGFTAKLYGQLKDAHDKGGNGLRVEFTSVSTSNKLTAVLAGLALQDGFNVYKTRIEEKKGPCYLWLEKAEADDDEQD